MAQRDEVVAQHLMAAADSSGRPVTLGAGVVEDGRIALLNNSPDGKAFLHVPAMTDYLGLVRRVVGEAAERA